MAKKFYIKNILLGIGIGIIISSSITTTFYSSNTESSFQHLDDEVIIRRAKELGMSFTYILPIQNPKDEKEDMIDDLDQNSTENNGDKSETSPEGSSEKDTSEIFYVKVNIPQGYNSFQIASILEESGVLKDRSMFIKEVDRLRLSRRLNWGTYDINSNMSISDLIKLLTY